MTKPVVGFWSNTGKTSSSTSLGLSSSGFALILKSLRATSLRSRCFAWTGAAVGVGFWAARVRNRGFTGSRDDVSSALTGLDGPMADCEDCACAAFARITDEIQNERQNRLKASEAGRI